ncbi:hypothetical protein [Dactylosporangium darangshiense]|uniref:hypothetical protein n=1 Tax=Dactylosporangium darangshiense TaxID=579108 RepID=UPI00362FFC64
MLPALPPLSFTGPVGQPASKPFGHDGIDSVALPRSALLIRPSGAAAVLLAAVDGAVGDGVSTALVEASGVAGGPFESLPAAASPPPASQSPTPRSRSPR